MIAHGQKFENVTIFLDGSSFYNCQFSNCNLVFSGVVGFLMDHPVYQNCRWTPQGPALQTIQLLSNLYSSGAVDLIEAVIKAIKSGPPAATSGGPA